MDTTNTIQSLSPRSRRLGVAAAAVLSVAAFMPVAGSVQHPFPAVSRGVAGSANAAEHWLLGQLGAGLAGSANAAEHRLMSQLGYGLAGSANAADHRLMSQLGYGLSGSANAAEHRLLSHLGIAVAPTVSRGLRLPG